MASEGTFYEDDEPVKPLVELLDAGRVELTTVAYDDDDEWKPMPGPCEFAVGAVTFNPAPVVTMCGKPGVARRGITWAEVIACNECYARWSSVPRQPDHSEEVSE